MSLSSPLPCYHLLFLLTLLSIIIIFSFLSFYSKMYPIRFPQSHMPHSPSPSYFIGVDIGSETVRAGLFDAFGHLQFAPTRRPIRTWRAPGGVVEQSGEQIWTAVKGAVRELLRQHMYCMGTTDAVLDAAEDPVSCPQQFEGAGIRGIGFCATCSMVVIDAEGRPLGVGGNPEKDQQEEEEVKPVRNVIVWMDQRAVLHADRINASGHPLLRFTGGRISPEMQVPKLLWLKENAPQTFARAEYFMDLADYCTWRATGSDERSICTLTCKWTYLGHEQHWDPDFFRAVGLGEFVDEQFRRIGQQVRPVGSPIGAGLSAQAAREFGLPEGIPVAAGLIDAHAGALGTICDGDGEDQRRQQMALVLGTSMCTMSLTAEPKFVRGVWGPYFGVVHPNRWLYEGGMTGFGSSLLFALRLHPFYHRIRAQHEHDSELLDRLERVAIREAGGSVEACSTAFGPYLHIVPDFLGNRSPDADPGASGIVCGLRMDDPLWADSEAGLAGWMITVMCALCYGVKLIIDQVELESGTEFDELVVSGGMVRSVLLLRLIADATQRRVFVPHCAEPVLLGAALVASVAAGHFGTIGEASAQMVGVWRERAEAGEGRRGSVMEPQRDERVVEWHRHKFEQYSALKRGEREIRRGEKGLGTGGRRNREKEINEMAIQHTQK